ncbi:LOW QUALITY PROTEIN: putative taste receptor type 2 member 33 [Trichechus inunguis]
MKSAVQIIVAVITIIEFVLRNFANGFIAPVNCIDWVKRQKISSADKILTTLVVPRIGMIWVIIDWYVTAVNSVLYRLEERSITITWAVNNHFSIWLATSLRIFYLFKISNFANFIFLLFKYLVILLGTLVFLGFHLAVVIRDDRMWMNDYEGTKIWVTKFSNIVSLSNLTVFMLAKFIPFTMSLASFLLLIFSMWKHLKKMQFNGKGSQESSIKVHIKAIQTVLSFLLLFAIYLLSVVISMWGAKMLQNKLVVTLGLAIGIVYPSSLSFILILGNKLRQAFLSVVWQLR